MKKILLPILLILCLLLSGCSFALPRSFNESDILAEVAGQDVTIVFDEGVTTSGTVKASHGEYSFSYDENHNLTMIYPDGRSCAWVDEKLDWPHDETAEELGYLPADELALSLDLASGVDLLRHPVERSGGVSPVLSIVLFAIGMWLVVAPKKPWNFVAEALKKDIEPRKRTLRIIRLVGLALIIAAIILLII